MFEMPSDVLVRAAKKGQALSADDVLEALVELGYTRTNHPCKEEHVHGQFWVHEWAGKECINSSVRTWSAETVSNLVSHLEQLGIL